ncbi:restriction endonuclease subunit S [uncultured Ruminococcus sp.]|uniref:restriction endonuclease subunit S n=1 Tax=uncultured Ruminococcus sp. TaxID=165186 RepID=UPI00266DC120|nr:restriction endonuclease subunit S [uncultured Ruminococcus sp.]
MAMRETRKLKYLCYILDEYRKPISAEKRNQNSDMLYDYYGASGAIDKIDGYTIDDHVMLIGEDGANLVFRNLPLMYEVNGKAWINNHAHILKPREDVDFYYLFYALENADIFPFVTGSAQPKLNQENLKLIPIPITNYETQKHIASFIKSKCKRIDSLITDIQSQIEALEEYKKSLVFRVVSKGIKKAALKNTVSDVWTAIPENWELIDIKYVFEIVKRIAGQEGFDVLSVTQKGLKVKDIESNNGQQAESYAGYQFVYPTDYVMNHMDLLTGWVDCSTMFGVTSPDYRVFRLRDKENNDLTYFKYVMQCCYMSRIFYSLGQGVSNLGRWRLQTSAFNNFMIPVPPLDEQRKIADYLDTKISEIDIIIAEKKQQIETIEEYKKSLIFEYVTGKKEVVNE